MGFVNGDAALHGGVGGPPMFLTIAAEGTLGLKLFLTSGWSQSVLEEISSGSSSEHELITGENALLGISILPTDFGS
eukprot:2470717-Karenia_brevis.AAC.1